MTPDRIQQLRRRMAARLDEVLDGGHPQQWDDAYEQKAGEVQLIALALIAEALAGSLNANGQLEVCCLNVET